MVLAQPDREAPPMDARRAPLPPRRQRAPREGNELHKWQQGLQQFYDLTLAFSGSRATVCDPFLGAGTTAVAAALLRRRFVGCDVDAACLVKTRARLDAVADNPALAAIVPPPVVSPSGR